MKVAEIKFTPWDKAYYFDPTDKELNMSDRVIAKTDLGVEIGDIVGFKDLEESELEARGELKKIIRRATPDDLAKMREKESGKDESLDYCKKLIDKKGLEMKLVDARFSFDGGRIVFAFVADGRIDFRELVKDLTRHFQKLIRLHQIGIRDEAKMCGDIGSCGRQLCCRKFLCELGNITSELAEIQQVAHRGSDRISGQCGRLMCCLAYEQKHYEDMIKNLPAIGTKFKTDRGTGRVIGHHVLRQTVNVKLDDDTMIEVPVKKK